MTLHAERTHPVPVDDCPACRWGSVAVSAMALPTRVPSVGFDAGRDAKLTSDLREYKALRQQGFQPPQVGGSAERARTARTPADIETPHPSKNKGKSLGTAIERRSERLR